MTRVAVRLLSMITVNIHEAKTQLSKLVDQAVKSEVFVMRPLVRACGWVASKHGHPTDYRAVTLAPSASRNRVCARAKS